MFFRHLGALNISSKKLPGFSSTDIMNNQTFVTVYECKLNFWKECLGATAHLVGSLMKMYFFVFVERGEEKVGRPSMALRRVKCSIIARREFPPVCLRQIAFKSNYYQWWRPHLQCRTPFNGLELQVCEFWRSSDFIQVQFSWKTRETQMSAWIVLVNR